MWKRCSLTICLFLLTAVIIWLALPEKYMATAKISDEYDETILSMGYDSFLPENVNGGYGLRSIEVYCRILESDEFRRDLSELAVLPGGVSYASYISAKDPIYSIEKHLDYNLSTMSQTVVLGFWDRNPEVAGIMMDNVLKLLKQRVIEKRYGYLVSLTETAKDEEASARIEYSDAVSKYSAFCDAHLGTLHDAGLARQKEELSQNVDFYEHQYNLKAGQLSRLEMLSAETASPFFIVKNVSVQKDKSRRLPPYLGAFLILGLITFFGWHLMKKRDRERAFDWGDLFSPWFITVSIWLLMSVLSFIYKDAQYPITGQFYLSVSIWIAVLVITSVATYNLLPERSVIASESPPLNKVLYYLFFILALVLCPLFFYKVWQVVSLFDLNEVMQNARIYALHNIGKLGLAEWGNIFSKALFLISLCLYPKVPKWHVFAMGAACCCFALAIMEKGSLFMMLFCTLFVLYERGKISFRSIAASLCVCVVFFFIFNIFRTGLNTDSSERQTFFDFINCYVASPPVAFSTLHKDIGEQFGSNTFSVLYTYLNKFGFGPFEAHPRIQEFVYVPIATNVYTILQPFYIDFGNIGVAFFAMIYGVLTGMLYRFFKNGNLFASCLYTYLVPFLILQFFQENIFSTLQIFAQISLVIFLCVQSRVKFLPGITFKS